MDPPLRHSRPEILGRFFLGLLLLAICSRAVAHPMPNSVLLLDVRPKSVAVELQLPLSQLELSFGHNVASRPGNLVERLRPELTAYLLAHIRPVADDGKPWTVQLTGMSVGSAEQIATGAYQELIVHLLLQPPPGGNTRKFTLHYDVIIHQVANHSALVSVRQDWEGGVTEDAPVEVGAVALNVRDNVIPPLQINLAEGSRWKGFSSMVNLGIRHIAEGTDHLMFLLVLLLPAPLLVAGKRWGGFGGTRYSVFRLLKIVTAFTIGHSITLLLGSTGWLRLPGRPVEIAIAFSIFISAIHALRPLFPGKEMFVAAGFGLVHGMAFASTLANLHLEAGPMALSILGFNLGIELMQLFVIAVTVPWLVILSRKEVYAYVRIAGASFAAVAALAWMGQRYLQKSNPLSNAVDEVAAQGKWMVFGLAVLAIIAYFLPNQKAAKPVGKRAG